MSLSVDSYIKKKYIYNLQCYVTQKLNNCLPTKIFKLQLPMYTTHKQYQYGFHPSKISQLSANPRKWSNILKQFVDFLRQGLALKGLGCNQI